MKIASIKKSLAVMMAAAALFTLSVMTVSAETDAAVVYVTVADDEGKLALVQEPVTVTDTDADGAITIADALYLAHEAKFDGGAAAGFASSVGEYGLKIDKLWGVENGGSYGYTVNHASAMGLADPVQNGDYISAYCYTDLTAWSDTYCWFDQNTLTAAAGDQVTLTLTAAGYDENWAPVTLPVAGAVITLNGEKTDFVTDAEGKVTVTFAKGGKTVISAVSDTQTLVPPACVADVEGGLPVVGIVIGAAAVIVIAAAAVVILKKKKA